MARPKEYRTRIAATLNFEMNVYEEFQDLCKKEEISVSKRLQDIMVEEIQKNALGSHNPIGVLYNLYNNKPNKSCQSDLTQWFDHVSNITNQQELLIIKGQASALCGAADKRSMELYRKGIKT